MNKDLTFAEYVMEKIPHNTETIIENLKEYNINPRLNDTAPKIVSTEVATEIDGYMRLAKNILPDVEISNMKIAGRADENYLFIVYELEVDIIGSINHTLIRIKSFFEQYRNYWNNFYDQNALTNHKLQKTFRYQFKQLNAGTLLVCVVDMYAVAKNLLGLKVPVSLQN